MLTFIRPGDSRHFCNKKAVGTGLKVVPTVSLKVVAILSLMI